MTDDPITEAELSLIWEGQRFPAGALRGPRGETVTVLNPGRRPGGPGPDFRDAVVVLGEEERRGDVELHVRASYWLQHGHHQDPAYGRLALHVVFEDDGGGASPLPDGASVPVAAFAPWLRARSADIAGWLERPSLWREPCRDAASRFGDAYLESVLAREGRRRFLDRVAALRRLAQECGAGEAAWQALLEVMGYGGDREGFRRLGRALPLALLREWAPPEAEDARSRAAAALMAAAGLEPAPPDLYPRLPAPLSPPLSHRGGRPANHPRHRLAAAAALYELAAGDIAGHALRTVDAARDARELVAAWSPRSGGTGLGVGRLAEVLVNAVVPLAALTTGLEERALALLGRLRPAPPYGKTRFLEENLARPDGRRRATSALDQQGLLALHSAWCTQGGCGKCPLSRVVTSS